MVQDVAGEKTCEEWPTYLIKLTWLYLHRGLVQIFSSKALTIDFLSNTSYRSVYYVLRHKSDPKNEIEKQSGGIYTLSQNDYTLNIKKKGLATALDVAGRKVTRGKIGLKMVSARKCLCLCTVAGITISSSLFARLPL